MSMKSRFYLKKQISPQIPDNLNLILIRKSNSQINIQD